MYMFNKRSQTRFIMDNTWASILRNKTMLLRILCVLNQTCFLRLRYPWTCRATQLTDFTRTFAVIYMFNNRLLYHFTVITWNDRRNCFVFIQMSRRQVPNYDVLIVNRGLTGRGEDWLSWWWDNKRQVTCNRWTQSLYNQVVIALYIRLFQSKLLT